MDYSAIIGAATGAFVLIAGKVIEWYTVRSSTKVNEKKQEAEDRLKEEQLRASTSIPLNDQAVQFYRELFENMKSDKQTMTDSIHFLEKGLLECRENALIDRAELVALRRKMSEGDKKQ